jgi:hypothetical protein
MAVFVSAFPLRPGQTEHYRRFNQEIIGPRRAEFEAACRRQGVTREVVALQQGPQGDVGIVYFEAPDIPRVFAELAASQEPFFVWFREQARAITGVDFAQPSPAPLPEVHIDGRAE